MPARFPFRACVLATLLSTLGAVAVLAAPAQAKAPPPTPSRLDRQLFLQVLVGELELRQGEVGSAFQVVLDAARKTKEEPLYRRAVDIALQAGFGEDALAAVKQWRSDIPGSLDAHRYQIQLLVALKRLPETAEPVGSLVKLSAPADRDALIANIPRFYSRAQDRKQAAEVSEQILMPFTEAAATRSAANVGLARAWFGAQDGERALQLLQTAQAQDPASEPAALLALEMLPTMPAAEAIVTSQLKAKPNNGVRLVYARVLSTSQRYVDAIAQLQAVTRSEPALVQPWLTLGALYLELRQPKDATAALERFVDLAQAPAPGSATQTAADDDTDTDTDDDAPAAKDAALTQAWLMLAQAAEQQNDFKAAERWLSKIDNPQRALEVMSRRASLMARQGKLKEARELIRRSPERSDDDAHAKVLAEVQLLRDAKQWSDANSLLAAANKKYPDDVDLLYEQSMMAEKLNRIDEMERLLRQVIALKPDHPHAHNALGYSLAERNVRLPEAKALIQKALEISPGEPFITDSLGWVEYRMGNRQEALRLLRSAYQARPDPEIAAHLGEVLWVDGQRDEARRIWREGRGRDSTNDVLRETLARLRVDL